MLGSRLREYRKKKGLTITELAAKIKISHGSLSDIETGKTKPSADTITSLSWNTNINITWLLTGVGDMERLEAEDLILEEQAPGYGPPGPSDGVKVDVFILAGAGHPKDLVESEPIDSIVLPKDFYKPSIIPVKVRGDSMYPLIFDGAYVGVDKADRDVVSGRIYAFWLPYEGAVIKRLFMDTDKVHVKSDNPMFPSISIPFSEIQNDNFILGRVVWIIQKV